MKKLSLTATVALVCLFLMSFVSRPTTTDSKLDSSWKARTTETLYNDDANMTLVLYSNSYCTLKGNGITAAGRYDIDKDNWITCTWEDYDPDGGFVTTIQTTSGTRIKSVVLKGYTFKNTERFVVPRH